MSQVAEPEGILMDDTEDAVTKVFTPIAQTIGEWRALINSPDKSRRKRGVKRAPTVLAAINQYKSALEEALRYMRYDEDREILRNYIQQLEEQVIKVSTLRDRRIAELTEEYQKNLREFLGNTEYVRP